MNLEEAKKLLNLCEREELRDHAFGDREVFWSFMGVEVAGAYFGSDASVWLYYYENRKADDWDALRQLASFSGSDAYELVNCGKLKAVERNDMQGDDIPRYQGA